MERNLIRDEGSKTDPYYHGSRLGSITLTKLSSCYVGLPYIFTVLCSHFA
jgi:hypothetical protein